MVSLLVDGTDLFTGDTLFRGSVGGVRAPGHTTYADLKSSIMDMLLTLPAQTRIHPGHTEPTTVAEELEHNRFVRIWRGRDPEGERSCTALGEPATLILLGDDYDGGHKAWVRWPDGRDDIVPGPRWSSATPTHGTSRHRRLARRASRPRMADDGGRQQDPEVEGPADRQDRRRWRPARRYARRARSRPTSPAPRRAATPRWSAATWRRPSRSSPRWGR